MTGEIQYNVDTIKVEEYPQILEVWEASVRATHHFFTEGDIQFFKPLVQNGLLHMGDLPCIRDDQDRI